MLMAIKRRMLQKNKLSIQEHTVTLLGLLEKKLKKSLVGYSDKQYAIYIYHDVFKGYEFINPYCYYLSLFIY